ncbi:28S ribosomal protein S21, mitochondrial-like [Mizuhopecten yessoensis]|uniref:28S ribosomal protein S21, mitochondrial-like n=1 Tax=Mizuhopecten yessoensis TaxID=6573 RepID=UPI000B45A6D0|nr:28S ribosomal protein S21, mitochondrial-like [Mizuhopecten yessoensis]
MSAGKHFKFISKTVLVKNNDIDTALLLLHRIMREDKVTQQIRHRMNGYEPPWMKRQRLSYERCKRLYTAEMERKVKLVLKKNRPNPWLR